MLAFAAVAVCSWVLVAAPRPNTEQPVYNLGIVLTPLKPEEGESEIPPVLRHNISKEFDYYPDADDAHIDSGHLGSALGGLLVHLDPDLQGNASLYNRTEDPYGPVKIKGPNRLFNSRELSGDPTTEYVPAEHNPDAKQALNDYPLDTESTGEVEDRTQGYVPSVNIMKMKALGNSPYINTSVDYPLDTEIPDYRAEDHTLGYDTSRPDTVHEQRLGLYNSGNGNILDHHSGYVTSINGSAGHVPSYTEDHTLGDVLSSTPKALDHNSAYITSSNGKAEDNSLRATTSANNEILDHVLGNVASTKDTLDRTTYLAEDHTQDHDLSSNEQVTDVPVGSDNVKHPGYVTFNTANPDVMKMRAFDDVSFVPYVDHMERPSNNDTISFLKAEEASEGRRSATAKLLVNVKPVDASPPVLTASSKEGFVQENSPVGTRVLDSDGKPIRLTVSDADLGPDDPKPTYIYEPTTDLFQIDNEGFLVVASEKDLDRDPPSPGRFRFQIVAREKTGNGASPPLTLTVILTDVNDNAPRLPMIQPISIPAGEGRRKIVQVNATDNDLGENAELSFSIYHVSNNGRNKFTINSQTGEVESRGKLTAGEQYSITVQATDTGGKSGQTIVEVKVTPGPNTRTPVFKKSVYEFTISEGASINSTVATMFAEDPEQEKVSYSIISGNDLRQFAINDKTGVISVIRKLDREDLTRYQLTIKAEDEGGLSTTCTVNILVSDINDKNPEFVDGPYEWSVKEGLVGAHVGMVHATDADDGMNANITYSVPDEVPFTINPQTGSIMTSTSLDYEQQKEYKFVVTAKDGGSEPRIATATVTVAVIDTEDEVPVFEKALYEATVPENVADVVVTTVKADDPDTTKAITYVIRQGPLEWFTIDPKNGTIKTLRGLDYESEHEYELVIGTLENNTTHKGATTTVRINVKDVNDIPPVFLTTPTPITLPDNASIGTEVTKLEATDSDGTAPGNKIRYEIIGRGKAKQYFKIDPDNGIITVKDNLSNEPDNEYQVDVQASDMGDPPLHTVTSVPVFVSHVAVSTPSIHLGFPDDSYTLQVPEDTKPGSLLKSFTVIDSASIQGVPLLCSLVEGNTDGLFHVNITKEKTCDLLLGDKMLDYEKQSEYLLKLRLDSLPVYINQNKSITMVKIQVVDVNDNEPKFIYPMISNLYNKEKYYGAVAKDKKEVKPILQVKAEDMDSSALTSLEYSLAPSNMSDYFTIDSHTGSIRTKRSLDMVEPDQLPIRLTVIVTDGKENANTASTAVVINVIDEGNRMVLPIKSIPPESASEKESLLSELMSKATGKMVGIDRVGPLEMSQDNVTLTTDNTSTDLWLYFIDPVSEKIMPINDTQMVKIIKDDDIKANITAEVTTLLGGGTVLALHAPVKVRVIRTAVVALDWEVFPYAVILIAGLILVLGTGGIVYICISWQRYKAYKERVQRMYVMPRYDPVFVEPNLKEYETQVLQMSVPMDDNDSYHDLQLDFSQKNHAFSLDNVSYITKDHGDNGGHSPTSSDAATTTRASTLGRHRNNIHDGAINLSYDRSDDEMGHNSSPTNDNVTFREKKDYSHLGFNYLMDRSPIETTTEL